MEFTGGVHLAIVQWESIETHCAVTRWAGQDCWSRTWLLMLGQVHYILQLRVARVGAAAMLVLYSCP